MIPVSSPTLDSNHQIQPNSKSTDWQIQMSNSLRTTKQLLDYLAIDEQKLPYKVDHNPSFKTRISRFLADRINPNDPYDPILLQVLPRSVENEEKQGYVLDPLHEKDFSPVPGLIHKYENRALLIAHQACAIHCRYCFRRHFPYEQQRLKPDSLQSALEYITQHPKIEEIILSGGDPLSLADTSLNKLLLKLNDIPQLKTIRMHSRTPVLLPERITEDLLKTIAQLTKKVIFVIHINHSNEISDELSAKLGQLSEIGVLLLNQSVLLKGINDRADIQIALSKNLFAHRVLPYYLHLLDPVQGTHHFNVETSEALSIWNTMQSELSGYLLPRLVKELPHRHSKTWMNNTD